MKLEEMKDKFYQTHASSKEGVVMWVDTIRKLIKKEAETDNIHSTGYYKTVFSMLDNFLEELDKTILPNNLDEDDWYLSVSITYAGLTLAMKHAKEFKCGSAEHVYAETDQAFPLILLPTKRLTVEEYANIYDVEVGTVRQWIRRGKIRTAEKFGKEWRIPELTELPSRGFKPAIYLWYKPLHSVPEQFERLHKYRGCIINQNQDDKNKFDIIWMKTEDNSSVYETVDSKEREQLEMFMISRPDIQYQVEFVNDALTAIIAQAN